MECLQFFKLTSCTPSLVASTSPRHKYLVFDSPIMLKIFTRRYLDNDLSALHTISLHLSCYSWINWTLWQSHWQHPSCLQTSVLHQFKHFKQLVIQLENFHKTSSTHSLFLKQHLTFQISQNFWFVMLCFLWLCCSQVNFQPCKSLDGYGIVRTRVELASSELNWTVKNFWNGWCTQVNSS